MEAEVEKVEDFGFAKIMERSESNQCSEMPAQRKLSSSLTTEATRNPGKNSAKVD